MAICAQCGKPVKDDAKFCGSCGASRTPTPPPPPEQIPAPPPPPEPVAAEQAVLPPAQTAQTPKKKGSSCMIIVIVCLLVGVVVLAAAGVGGYFVWKKAKAKAQAKLAEVTQMAEQQAKEAEESPQQNTQEPAPEPSPEQAPPPETAPSEPAPAVEPSTPPPATAAKPAPKPKPAPAAGTAKPVDPTQDIQPDQVNLDNLNKPLVAAPAPAPSASAAPVAQPATLGLILESEAPGTKLVVKVDGVKVFEQDMVASKNKQRISKELPVTAGPHHIRVAVWRPPQEPVAGEWDYTFDAGSHPVFRLDLGSNWKMEVKRFQ